MKLLLQDYLLQKKWKKKKTFLSATEKSKTYIFDLLQKKWNIDFLPKKDL